MIHTYSAGTSNSIWGGRPNSSKITYKDEIVLKDNEFLTNDNAFSKKGFKKFEVSQVESIKNYMFIKGTKFDREFFRRTFGHLKRTILPEKADIILYDKESLYKYIIIRDMYGSYYLDKNDDSRLYWCSGWNSELPDQPYSLSATTTHLYLANTSNCLNGKLMEIADFLGAKQSSLSTKLSYSDLAALFRQATSPNVTSLKTALDTISSYSSNDGAKFLLLYCANIKHNRLAATISNKVKFDYDRFKGRFLKNRYKNDYDGIDHIHQIVRFVQESDSDNLSMIVDILNSKDFSDFILGKNHNLGEYSINFRIERTKVESAEETDLDNFLL